MQRVLAESGNRREESKASDCWSVRDLGVNGTGGEDSECAGLEIHTASLASIWLCIELPTARLRRVVMGSALAACCRTVMKKQICT